ncbi:App1 family protein [Ekhidna sp. To15]|uniref:App1 family protein n=1 Tax=Ekhidna sp. To15 TaxID=3395267 RepID=UPI003F51FEC8
MRPPTVIPYRGYGNATQISISGHVLENRPNFLASETDKKRKNFKNMLARYMSTAIPDTEVNVYFKAHESSFKTDELGFFQKSIALDLPAQPGWHTVTFTIKDEQGKECSKEEGEVLIVNDKATFGVISDIDDTVLISHATQLLRKLRLILTKNAKTRLPFEGVREFYHKLAGDNSANPIFYVSSSEWNLFDFLKDFFETQNLPKGPFLLQRFKEGLKELIKSGGGTHMHKQEKIEALMECYTDLPFVLIGDSGQRDPEIYAEIVKKYPKRIKAIYIRAIGKNKELSPEVEQITQNADVPVLMVSHTDEAYRHAVSIGLIKD